VIIFLGNGHSLDLYSDFIAENKDCKPDIVVSCQYPHKIPESLIASHICVNIHYGLLPAYAGCNPIYWQLLQGSSCGTTLHYVDNNWDSGDIIAQFQIPTGSMTASEAYDQLANAGLMLLKKNFASILNSTAIRSRQDASFRHYYNKKDIDFKQAKHLGKIDLPERKVRALCFEGKQYPIITVGNRNYELRPI